MIPRRTTALLFTPALLLLSSISALAQSQTTGRIAGTVKDQNGAVIVGAHVTVVNKATGSEREVATDTTGNYTVQSLTPGNYDVAFTANGFKKGQVDNVIVNITETRNVNAELEVGVVSESVTISTGEPLIQIKRDL